jgi:hypothetical protein
MRLVPRAHRAQCAPLMIREFIVGIPMLRAEDASGARVASRRAIRFHFHAMRQAVRDVPPGRKCNRVGRTCSDATSRHASRTRVEGKGLARRIQIDVDN